MTQGISATLGLFSVPALLALPSANNASTAFAELTRTTGVIRTLAGISATTFLAAFVFAPEDLRHPYLLWSTLLVGASGCFDLFLGQTAAPVVVATKKAKEPRRRMDASYEMVGDSTSEGKLSDYLAEETVNGEELRKAMVQFATTEKIRYAVSSMGFVLSLVGLWGDGPW